MDTPQISRSGRVLKKSAKVKEMEDFDINDLDMQGKPRKKGRLSDEYDEFDDKRVAPIKIPKISLNVPPGAKRPQQIISKVAPPHQVKAKMGRFMMRDSSPDGSKESDSSSMSSETTSSSASSSDDSDSEMSMARPVKGQIMHNPQPPQQEKVIVESYRQFDSPVTFGGGDSNPSEDDDENSDSALVIAEESNDSFAARGQKGKKRVLKKDPAYPPRKGGPPKKRPPAPRPAVSTPAKKAPAKPKALSAYTLWCNENRKKISSAVGFGNIGKKLGEAWQALSDKEKMAWRRKAKKLAQINDSRILLSATQPPATPKAAAASRSTATDDLLKNLAEGSRALGTAAIDSAAYLKLLGDSLSVIGQRLTEHEGQLAVSGIFSVLLDTVLCVVGPMLCLTAESPLLDALSPDVTRKTLDSIAYFMPGL